MPSHSGQPCRFLYNTGSESTSGKRGVYRTFASECQTQFPGGQNSDKTTLTVGR